jgi:hypothetical protein
MSIAAGGTLGNLGTSSFQMAMPNINNALGGGTAHAHGGGCCGGGIDPGLSIIGSNKEGECRRLDLTGDKCITIDVCKAECVAARWLEETFTAEPILTKCPSLNAKDDSRLCASVSDIITSVLASAAQLQASPRKPSNVTLVVPGSFTCKHHIDVFMAAPGMVKHIFHRPIATVVGALSRMGSAARLILQNAHSADIDAYLYVYICKDNANAVVFEAAVVLGEGKENARSSSNALGYDRMATAAQLSSSWTDYSDSQMQRDISGLLTKCGVSADEIVAVVFEGSSAPMSILNSASVLQVNVDKNDAAIGACLLSAAELSSSKLYMNSGGGVKLCFILPIADGYLPFSVGVQTEDSLAEGKGEVRLIFEGGARLPKLVGPVRNTSAFSKTVTSLSFERKSAISSISMDFPKLHILESRGDNASKDWTLVHSVQPLIREQDAVLSCKVTISVDPLVSVVKVEKSRDGKLVKEARGVYWKILTFVLLLFFGIVGKLSIDFFRQRAEADAFEADVRWLVDVYAKVNPEKLKEDSNLPQRLIGKYRAQDKMWVLHRKLEQEYGVKQKKPPSIGDLDL